jgi:hypothetical protein
MTRLEELQSFYSDFHKDLFGFRPKTTENQWNSAEWLQDQIEMLDNHLQALASTPEGKAELRAEGWNV